MKMNCYCTLENVSEMKTTEAHDVYAEKEDEINKMQKT